MARVTVEDCVLKVPNRFDLVMYASQRARDISAGLEETIDRDNDKNPVIALREIAEETVVLADLKESLVLGLQKQQPNDDLEDDLEAVESLQHDSIIMGGAEEAAEGGEEATPAGTHEVASTEALEEAAVEAAAPDAEGAEKEA